MARFEINLQLALNVDVEVEAETFEAAVIRGREMVKNCQAVNHMAKRSLLKTDRAVTIQDCEGHFIGVRDGDAGCMYQ